MLKYRDLIMLRISIGDYALYKSTFYLLTYLLTYFPIENFSL